MGVPLLWDVIWELGIAPRALMGFLVGTFYTIVCRSPVVPALAQQMQPAPELGWLLTLQSAAVAVFVPVLSVEV